MIASNQKQILQEIYDKFKDEIEGIYQTGSSCIPFIKTSRDIDIAILLNKKPSEELKTYVKSLDKKEIGLDIFLDNFRLEQGKKAWVNGNPSFDFSWYHKYYFTQQGPILGKEIEFDTSIEKWDNPAYVAYLFGRVFLYKINYSNPYGVLDSYTKIFYPLILTTYILINNSYELTLEQQSLVIRAHDNRMTQDDFNNFKQDLYKLMKKHLIVF